MDIFRAYFADKQLVENDRFHGNFLGTFCRKAITCALIWQTFLTTKDANFASFFQKLMTVSPCNTSSIRNIAYRVLPYQNWWVWRKIWATHLDYCTCLYLFGKRFFLLEIIICVFNNNALKKTCKWQSFFHHGHSECPVFHNINIRTPGSFGMLSTFCNDEVSR